MSSSKEVQITYTGEQSITLCTCVLYLKRIRDVLNGKGFNGIETELKHFFLKDDVLYFNNDDWIASGKKFIDWLSETYSLEVIEKVGLLLQNCGCNRNDKLILFNSLSKSTTKR